MSDSLRLDYTPHHVCETCKFVQKCSRMASIVQAITAIECNSFESWEIDVDIEYMIKDCPRYKPNFELMNGETLGGIDDE